MASLTIPTDAFPSPGSSHITLPHLNEDGSNWILYRDQFMSAVYAKGLRRYLEGRDLRPVHPSITQRRAASTAPASMTAAPAASASTASATASGEKGTAASSAPEASAMTQTTVTTQMTVTVAPPTPEALEEYETKLNLYYARHNTIKTLLYQTLPETLKLEIAGKDHAVDMWKVVTDKYDRQGDFVQVSIMRQMQSLKCDDGADPRITLNQLARLKSEYATAGGTLASDQYKEG
ncbi:hypothetical protein GSI_09123 [Ganoderma sinense ZZ0214-1]|uniref:Uncharacterized protein n=1 Tax=Ganoderma sinense ZZ0214-1 TaxID=1077348 RepID=A0A2G8S5Q0_9APHY|nr:hypothetical protein GSI_09123 [Ganoderma sinense ZZ0214-1]